MHVAMRSSVLNQLGGAADRSRPQNEPDLGSLQPPGPKRRKPGAPKEVVMKRPSACLNPDRPEPDTDWEPAERKRPRPDWELAECEPVQSALRYS